MQENTRSNCTRRRLAAAGGLSDLATAVKFAPQGLTAERQSAQDPQRQAWLRSWRGNPAAEQDRQLINRYRGERARGGPQAE